MSRGGLSGPSELALRHAGRIAKPGLLLVNPPADGVVPALEEAGAVDMQVNVWRRSAERSIRTTSAEVTLDLTPAAGEAAGALLYIPREKALASAMVGLLATRLQRAGTLWVVGDNRAGGKSADRLLGARFGTVRKVDAARRSSLFEATGPHAASAPAFTPEQFEISIGGRELTLCTLAGVFSAGRLDTATALLLEHLPPLDGRILDFGCGCGVIGAVVAAGNPQTDVTLLDDSIFAVAASRATLAANALQGRVVPSDGLMDVEGSFDAIISNPPFHQGADTDYDVAEGLIASAPERLFRGGQLLIVANDFLDYGRRMRDAFGNCEILAQARGFRVYCSRRSR